MALFMKSFGVNKNGVKTNFARPSNTASQVAPYTAPVQESSISQTQVPSYLALAQAAEAERKAMMQREADRQNAVISGYQQQMQNSQQLSNQAYQQLAADYAKVTADAAATRERNMGRVDSYGNSMRQDLEIQNAQRLAQARQSAIQRGLGNTTIQDSLVRGQNFDNTRQQLTLEDQLLQNRIATDSQLSGVYQGALQNRAQGLNTQLNQNIANQNQLASNRLGYIGSIQDNMDGFNTVANLYTGLYQMQNANEQARLDRELRNPNSTQNRPTLNYSIKVPKQRW